MDFDKLNEEKEKFNALPEEEKKKLMEGKFGFSLDEFLKRPQYEKQIFISSVIAEAGEKKEQVKKLLIDTNMELINILIKNSPVRDLINKKYRDLLSAMINTLADTCENYGYINGTYDTHRDLSELIEKRS